MKNFLLAILLSATGLANVNGQQVVNGIVPGSRKFHHYVSIGGGSSFSVINNRMEIRGMYKHGWHATLDYHVHDWFFWSGEFTWFPLHNSAPAIEDIHSWNTEMNANFCFGLGATDMRFKSIVGLGYLSWNGTFVGPALKDKNNWYFGMNVAQNWMFGVLGCGLERNFGKNFTANADFRFRFASEEKDLLSISDTGFFFGLNWNIHVFEPGDGGSGKTKRRTNNNQRSRIYKWLKNR